MIGATIVRKLARKEFKPATLFLITMLISMAPPAFSSQKPANPVEQNPETIDIIARRYAFKPSTIQICAGKPVILRFKSVDTNHGFQIKKLKINVKLKKKKMVTVKLKVDKPGVYYFRCSVYCGKGHKRMRGKLIVRSCDGPENQGLP